MKNSSTVVFKTGQLATVEEGARNEEWCFSEMTFAARVLKFIHVSFEVDSQIVLKDDMQCKFAADRRY